MSFFKRFFTLGGDDIYEAAIAFYNDCRYKEAIAQFDKIIERDKGKSRLHKELAMFYRSQAFRNSGIVHMHEGRFTDAMLDFKKALDVIPDSTILHSYLGVCYNNVGMFREAAIEFQKVLEDKEQDVKARISLGLALRNQGFYDKGISELQKAIKMNPAHADLHYFLGLVLCNTNKYEEAIEEFNKSLQINPSYLEALSKLGFLYVLAGDLKKAEEVFEKIKVYFPEDKSVQGIISSLKQGDAERRSMMTVAKEELFEAIAISLSLRPFVTPDISRDDKGLYKTLINVYNQILEQHPNYADIHFKLAEIYEHQERYADARTEYKEALSINPDYTQAHISLGYLYKIMDKYEDAIKELEFVMGKGLPYPTVAFELGMLYLRLNNKEKAARAFQKALDIDPNFEDAKKELDSFK